MHRIFLFLLGSSFELAVFVKNENLTVAEYVSEIRTKDVRTPPFPENFPSVRKTGANRLFIIFLQIVLFPRSELRAKQNTSEK